MLHPSITNIDLCCRFVKCFDDVLALGSELMCRQCAVLLLTWQNLRSVVEVQSKKGLNARCIIKKRMSFLTEWNLVRSNIVACGRASALFANAV